MRNEQLLKIQEDLIKNLELAISSYIEAFIDNNTSVEAYVRIAQHEEKWRTLKLLLKTHFPEVDIKKIQETVKENTFEYLKENEELEEDELEVQEKIKDINSHLLFY